MIALGSQETQTLASWQEGVIASDLLSIERILNAGLESEDKLPQELSKRLLEAGGKRIRPMLLCLVYRSLEKHPNFAARGSLQDLHTLAAVSEWVHTATLFHDDVLDDSPERRGIEAAHIKDGNKVAILVGDFVYAEAFAILMERGLLEPSQKLAHTIKALVEGELWQHRYARNRRIVPDEYIKVAESKTAALFSWATESGAWLSGAPVAHEARSFGRHLGIAFQIADDFIDCFSLNCTEASAAELNEWASSAPPLPLIIASEEYPEVASQWETLVEQQESQLRAGVSEILALCRDDKVLSRCQEWLDSQLGNARAALEALGNPPSLEQAVRLLENRGRNGIALAKDPSP